MVSTDMLKWYFLIHGIDDDAFRGGEYILHIVMSPRYPFSPPEFRFLTPSGRFQINTKICLSYSSYHADTWTPMWNLRMMVVGFISTFTDSKVNGAGHLHDSINEQQEYAKQSVAYNWKHHRNIMEMICEQNDIAVPASLPDIDPAPTPSTSNQETPQPEDVKAVEVA